MFNISKNHNKALCLHCHKVIRPWNRVKLWTNEWESGFSGGYNMSSGMVHSKCFKPAAALGYSSVLSSKKLKFFIDNIGTDEYSYIYKASSGLIEAIEIEIKDLNSEIAELKVIKEEARKGELMLVLTGLSEDADANE